MYNSFSIYDENRLFLFVYFVSSHVFFLKLEQKEKKKTNKKQALRAKVGFKELSLFLVCRKTLRYLQRLLGTKDGVERVSCK